MQRALSVGAALVLLCLAGTFCSLASAASPRRVLVIGSPSDATCSGLIEALRIQLGQAAVVVRVDPSERGQDGSTEVEAARQFRAKDVAIVLWIQEASEQSRVFALTGTAPSRRAELAALSAASPERERTVALKVGELLESESNEPKASDPALIERSRARTRAFVELGARLWRGGTPTQLVAGSALAIGPRWEWPSTVLEAHGAFAFDSGIHASAAVGQVDIDTVFVGLGSRLLWRAGPLAIGPYFDAGIDVIRARGATPDKHVGASELLLPTAGAGCDARLHLAQHFELRASAGPQLYLVHERLALEGRWVLDLGWAHASGSVSGVIAFP